jgi:hypothetical protein
MSVWLDNQVSEDWEKDGGGEELLKRSGSGFKVHTMRPGAFSLPKEDA